MANESKVYRGTQKTLSTTIGSVASNAISAACGSYSTSDTGGYPDAEFVLKVTYASAPTEGTTIDLLLRPLNVQSTNDADAPQATYQPHKLGAFVVDNVTSAQYLFLRAYDLPAEGEFYLYNNNTGQSWSANAELYMTPVTLGPV